jgi:isoquinoline 1-oxidoreductase
MRGDKHLERDVYEEYLELNFSDVDEMNPTFPLDRRQFLKLVGGGIVVLFSVPSSLAFQEDTRRRREELPEDFNAFLRIGEDGRVTGFTGKIEMGQGIITSLAQMLVDELDVALDSVDMVMGDTDLCPWDRGTFGSMSTRFFGPAFRAAAGEAKAVLVELAADHLQVAKDRLTTKGGVIHDEAGQKKVSYAELTKGRKIIRRLKGEVVLETPAEFTLVGKPTSRRDGREKVTGRAKFAGDLREPGLLHARILRPPVHGAKIISVDLSGARAIEGAHVVQEGDLIAVLHEYPDLAEKALMRIKSHYDRPASDVDDKTIFDHLETLRKENEEPIMSWRRHT